MLTFFGDPVLKASVLKRVEAVADTLTALESALRVELIPMETTLGNDTPDTIETQAEKETTRCQPQKN